VTLLQLRELSGPSWTIRSVDLINGHWVLLTENSEVAQDVARQLIGLSAPRKGTVSLNGSAPCRNPATRAICSSLLAHETLSFVNQVDEIAPSLSNIAKIVVNTESMLRPLGLQHLSGRTIASLSSSERQQLALALSMAQTRAQLVVYCEPLGALSASQCRAFHEHVAGLARRSCVLSITSSMHDARQLGGPHARLTRNDWRWADTNASVAPLVRLIVEGVGLRRIMAKLAIGDSVMRLGIDVRRPGCESLEVVALAHCDIAREVLKIARQEQAKITRVLTEEGYADSGEVAPTSAHHDSSLAQSSVHGNHAGLGASFRASLTLQWHVLSTTLISVAGIVLLLGEPVLASAFAKVQIGTDSAWAVQESLVFLATCLVPIWSLLVCRALYAQAALGGVIEPLARLGANRRVLSATRWALVALVCAALGGVSAVPVVLLSRGASRAALLEMGTSMWIAALGGAVYGGILTALSDARRTWLLWGFVVADFALGGTSLGMSAPFPHAHLRNLLGSASAIDVSQQVSCIFLGVLLLLAIGLTQWRTDP
jgi:ABC-type taurine transport system ATPase subunit